MLVPVEADAAAGLARSAGSARLDRPDRRDWSGPIDGGAAAATRGARCATVWELRGSLLLDLTRGYRDGEWLRIPLPDPRPEGLADGTHPHDVRRRLIAEGLLPGKWLNRLFSVGGIRLENEQMAKIEAAIDKAAAKGAKESLLLMNDLALIVNVKNRTIVTAMDGQSMRDNVFTQIDSAVVISS